MAGQFSTFVAQLSLTQKILMGVVALVAIGAVVGLVALVNQPSYGTLFSNLEPDDASKIVEKLKERKVPYTLDDNGKTILVPKQQIYDLRLALVGQGLPKSSVVGYELFGRTNLGVSDFVQKVHYRRALEGELARTILQLDEVEGARVHLVVPQKAIFKEDEKPATASVVLRLKSGRKPKPETIQGIAHLVASSVEGLEASNVTILDARGMLLSDHTKPNSLASLTSSQYELQRNVEGYLAQKAQRLLEGVVGTGNAIVQVNADLDFRQIERTLEQYDPEKTAIRSEQTTEEKTSGKDSSTPSTRSNTTTNYEVNKSLEHIVENVGSIKRLTVAALVNGSFQPVERNGVKETEYQPRTEEELRQLTQIVKNAVGYSEQRADQVSVVNMPFGNALQADDFISEDSLFRQYSEWIEKGVLIVAMLAALVIVRSLLNRLRVQVTSVPSTLGDPAIAALGQSSRHRAELAEPVSEEAILRDERRRRVSTYLKEKPEEASRLLKVWLAEG
jgi:flagellar M-ring protein FliF